MQEAWQAGKTQSAVAHSPINADGTEIEDAGCTHHHIQSDKDVTVDLAEAPLTHYLEEKNINKWQVPATVNATKSLHLGRNNVFFLLQ